GSTSVPVAHIDPGALFNKEARGGHLIVADGHQQWRNSIGISHLEICARIGKNLYGLQPAVSRCIQQRRETARNKVARAAIRQPATNNTDTMSETGDGIRQNPAR